MEGTVRNFDPAKGFGRIKVDGGNREVFAHKAECKSGQMSNDARVTFDIDETAAKGPRAVNITVLSAGTPQPQLRPPESKGLSVTWHFGEAKVQAFQTPPAPPEDLLALPLTLAVKRGNQTRSALVVTLVVDGVAQYENVTADGTLGQADFEIVLSKDASRSFMKAVVKDGDQEITSQRIWSRSEHESAKTNSLKVIKSFRGTTSDNYTTFRVLALTGDEKTGVEEEIDIDSTEVLEIRWKGKPHTGSFVAEKGHALVEVRTKEPKRTAVVNFRSVSNPVIVSESQTLEPWEPKKVKTCKVIKAKVLTERPGYLNALSIEALTEAAENTEKISAKLAVESAVEISVDINGTEHRGRRIEFNTNANGTRVVRIYFINPRYYGNIDVVSSDDETVSATAFVRHPLSASKPA